MPPGSAILYSCLMGYGGDLIASRSLENRLEGDGDRLSIALQTILNFVERAYPSSGQTPFEALDHGPVRVLVEKGKFCLLILVIEGKEDEALREGMHEILARFEERNEPDLAEGTLRGRLRRDGQESLSTASNLMKVF
ncbi:MAG: hypothetical protein V3W28_09280 [Thermoplasmata archaeon]